MQDIEELAPGYLASHGFEKLQAFVRAMAEIPELKDYRACRRWLVALAVKLTLLPSQLSCALAPCLSLSLPESHGTRSGADRQR